MVRVGKYLSLMVDHLVILAQTYFCSLMVSILIHELFQRGMNEIEIAESTFGIWVIGWIIYLSSKHGNGKPVLSKKPSGIENNNSQAQPVSSSISQEKELFFRFIDKFIAVTLYIVLGGSLLLGLWFSITN